MPVVGSRALRWERADQKAPVDQRIACGFRAWATTSVPKVRDALAVALSADV